MNIYYLYVKTHNKTGLRYLGQTSKQDPYTYPGSGKDWLPHLVEHGFDFTTTILKECKSKQELNEFGRYYSTLWDVANSPDWANRIPETGGGSCSPETAKKISEALKGRSKPPRTQEHTDKLTAANRGQKKPRTLDHQKLLTECVKNNWKNNDERRLKTAEVGKANKGRKHTPEALEKKRQAMLEYWRLKKSQAV